MRDQHDIIWCLPADIATALSVTEPGSARWADVVKAIAAFYEQGGDVCPEWWADNSARQWLESGCPDQPDRAPQCVHCGDRLTGSRCVACDLVFGESWWQDPDKRVQIGLFRRPWPREVRPSVTKA